MARNRILKTVIIGIGGAGCNVIRQLEIPHSSIWAVDSEPRSLSRNKDAQTLLLQGQVAVSAAYEALKENLRSAKQVFLISGLGGRTGTKAILSLSQLAKKLGAKITAIVIFPFKFEGLTRKEIAQGALRQLKDQVDVLKIIQNETINKTVNNGKNLSTAFGEIDNKIEEEIRALGR